jgi:uncharacterized protein (TIGR00299 family) protein
VIGWIDASSGASGDMLLGAVVDAGADEAAVAAAIGLVAPERISLSTERVRRSSLDALRAHVEVADSTTERRLDDILGLIEAAGLDPAVARAAGAVFTRLGEVEAAVHGVEAADVHFHEVGALDSIADIVGVCAGLALLDLESLHCSPVAVGSGLAWTRHGRLSIPVPAVAALLTGVPTYAGPAPAELCTPTGAALLSHFVDHWGPQRLMTVSQVGTGAGAKDFPGHPNVLRLMVGDPVQAPTARAATAGPSAGSGARRENRAVVLETNVDDLDPRLWPAVLARLLAAGAADAWLTPIVMKKGRPAHTLSVLAAADRTEQLADLIFTETSAIGLREVEVGKVALEREHVEVVVAGQRVKVKLALRGGVVVNVQPEYEDVVAAATALDRPAKVVLAEAVAAASRLWIR